MNCKTCHYSTGVQTENGIELWCSLLKAMRAEPCHRYVYEPGTTDDDPLEPIKAGGTD
jgi:hypothetical protein